MTDYLKENKIGEFQLRIKEWSVLEKEKSEEFNENSNSFVCDAFIFGKKRLLNKLVMNINQIRDSQDVIGKSQMVVFQMNSANKKIFLKELVNCCRIIKKYGPIIEVGENEVHFFPNLDYGDVYLIKDLFQEKYIGQKINVMLGEISV